jgi:hypothetical protein
MILCSLYVFRKQFIPYFEMFGYYFKSFLIKNRRTVDLIIYMTSTWLGKIILVSVHTHTLWHQYQISSIENIHFVVTFWIIGIPLIAISTLFNLSKARACIPNAKCRGPHPVFNGLK